MSKNTKQRRLEKLSNITEVRDLAKQQNVAHEAIDNDTNKFITRCARAFHYRLHNSVTLKRFKKEGRKWLVNDIKERYPLPSHINEVCCVLLVLDKYYDVEPEELFYIAEGLLEMYHVQIWELWDKRFQKDPQKGLTKYYSCYTEKEIRKEHIARGLKPWAKWKNLNPNEDHIVSLCRELIIPVSECHGLTTLGHYTVHDAQYHYGLKSSVYHGKVDEHQTSKSIRKLFPSS